MQLPAACVHSHQLEVKAVDTGACIHSHLLEVNAVDACGRQHLLRQLLRVVALRVRGNKCEFGIAAAVGVR